MKNIAPTALFALVGFFLLIPPVHATGTGQATSLEDVEKEAGEFVETLQGYGADKRDAAIDRTARALESLDRRIDAMETRIDQRWDRMDQAARQRARASLRALRKQRTRVAEWYGGLKNSSVDAWGHLRNGFSNAYRELHEALVKSKREFDSAQ